MVAKIMYEILAYLHNPTDYTLLSSTWRMASPSAEDRQTQDGTPYKWSDYVHKVSSIVLVRHVDAERGSSKRRYTDYM